MATTAAMAGSWMGSLVCPIDHAPLRREQRELRCSTCDRRYRIDAGIPNFREQLPIARSASWTTAQDYELSYWSGVQQELTGAREARLKASAEGLTPLLDRCAGPGWRHRVLHVGPAGTGEVHYLDAAERYAAEPLACDLQSRGLLKQHGVHWVATMGEYLPFPDGFFSLVLIPNVIDHVADPQRVLAEIRRCLMPGGHVWLSCHVASPLINPLFRLLHVMKIGYFAGHLWFYSVAGLNRLCATAGLREVWTRTETIDSPAFLAKHTLRERAKRRLLSARYLRLSADAV